MKIRYQVWVAKNLKGACDVIHSPWDYVDGGALDSKYGLQCLTFLISTFNLKKVHYDAIVFNFGLHDVDCFGNSPEEYTTAAEYHQNIQRLKTSLLKTGAKVGFVLTTPIPYNKSRNEMVVHYNNIAREIMAEKPSIQVANLYQWVVNVCGEPPYNSCKIADKQPSPHYTVDGYRYLATLVTKLFHHLLSEVEKQPKKIVLLKSVTSKVSLVFVVVVLRIVCYQSYINIPKYTMAGPTAVTTITTLNFGTRCTVIHCRIALWGHQIAQIESSEQCIMQIVNVSLGNSPPNP